MSKIHFLGTLSGAEPIEGMHHTATCFEIGSYYYWFDAGENCSRNGHLSGIDILNIKSVFITHTHMDHVGGLGNLMWNIRKLTTRCDRRPPDKRVNLFIPDIRSWNGIHQMLLCSENDFVTDYDIVVAPTLDGLLYEDENIKVTAFHNHHMQNEKNDLWLAYSYVIETGGKKIVLSGDIRDLYDLDEMLKDGCDLLLLETGHHKIDNVNEYLKTKDVKKLIFMHHGREIINERQACEEKVKTFPCNTVIAYDGMIEEI